ncbi:MAG: hypothetical protein KBC92_08060 [Giesbergeria sp.]|nr:hypothetical protein [Giesbergeria sp.]
MKAANLRVCGFFYERANPVALCQADVLPPIGRKQHKPRYPQGMTQIICRVPPDFLENCLPANVCGAPIEGI